LNDTVMRARKSATAPSSMTMSSFETSATRRSRRVFEARSTAVFAASSQLF
jgi:hypothetical protein